MSQSLGVFPGTLHEYFYRKSAQLEHKAITKNVLFVEEIWPVSAPPTPLIIKAVYVVNSSWYGSRVSLVINLSI